MAYKKGMFKGKKITVMGLGLLGRGVGDAEFLAREGAELIVTDLKSEKDLGESLKRLKRFKNISFTLGKHDLKDFENRDFILKSASVPLDSLHIAHARKKKVKVLMSTALFALHAPAKIIGITGTRGKSTVTQMIYEGLKRTKKRVYLGGNVRGMSTLALLPKIKKGDICVLELDSWQLQGFGDLKISPNIAVFTTFMPDHLNYYKGDLDAYFKDKANIFKYQKKGDVKIIGDKVGKIGKKYTLPEDIRLQVPGEHNRYNAALAYEVLKIFKISHKDIKKSLESFTGVSGRLQNLGLFKGIKVYNDTTATTPHALSVALQSLRGEKVVLITGGADKNINLDVLRGAFDSCKAVILLPGTGTDRLLKEKIILRGKKVKSMKEAVRTAFKEAKKGDVILLSPGFASFGLFKNEYDRGDQFVSEVRRYKK
jgi:UDP-N-acetylmuramoylalanine--D-glutamate ligase